MSRIQLPRQDHYEVALRTAVGRFTERLDSDRLRELGADILPAGGIELPSLCWRFGITLDPFSLRLLPAGESVNVVWQVLVLEYLSAGRPRPPARFMSFADFPQARGYLKAFEARVIQRISGGVGSEAGRFEPAAERCGGIRGASRPLTFLFAFFPRFELQVVRHEGDEEFPPLCNVFFPDNAPDLLSPESMAVAAERLIASLEGRTPAG